MQDVCCTTTRSWQGRRYALPLHPSGCGALRGIEPLPAPVKRFAVSSCAGRLRSPLHPIDQGAFHSPRGPLARLFHHPAHEQREMSLSLMQSLRPTLRGLDAANSSTCWIMASVSTAGLRPRICPWMRVFPGCPR